MPRGGMFYLSRVRVAVDGNPRLPEWDPDDWRKVAREYHDSGKIFPHPCEYIDYLRK